MILHRIFTEQLRHPTEPQNARVQPAECSRSEIDERARREQDEKAGGRAGGMTVVTAASAVTIQLPKMRLRVPAASQTSTAAAASAHNHADMMFAHMMIPHHQQAVQMSDMILAKRGIDPQVVQLATQIKRLRKARRSTRCGAGSTSGVWAACLG